MWFSTALTSTIPISATTDHCALHFLHILSRLYWPFSTGSTFKPPFLSNRSLQTPPITFSLTIDLECRGGVETLSVPGESIKERAFAPMIMEMGSVSYASALFEVPDIVVSFSIWTGNEGESSSRVTSSFWKESCSVVLYVTIGETCWLRFLWQYWHGWGALSMVVVGVGSEWTFRLKLLDE